MFDIPIVPWVWEASPKAGRANVGELFFGQKVVNIAFFDWPRLDVQALKTKRLQLHGVVMKGSEVVILASTISGPGGSLVSVAGANRLFHFDEFWKLASSSLTTNDKTLLISEPIIGSLLDHKSQIYLSEESILAQEKPTLYW